MNRPYVSCKASLFSDHSEMKLEINNRGKTGKFIKLEIKQHATKQPVDQGRNHKENWKILKHK